MVVESSSTFVGIEGLVVGESKKMVTFLCKDKEKIKRIPKLGNVFLFQLDDKHAIRIEGKALIGRPEQRLKKRMKKW